MSQQSILTAYGPAASAAQQRDYLTHLHQTLSAPSHGESMNYEGRMMKRGRLSGVFSYFIIHHSTLLSLLRLTADSPALLAIIKQEGKVLNLTRRRGAA